jgi:subtilisin-like proprotein convertase family protein
VTLMSDAGGTGAVDANLTFSDEAGSDVPAGSGIPSSTYRSANYDDPSDYQPDPFTDAGARLSAFQGRTANGTWSLYVDDDSPDDEGTLDGWTLHITTQQPPPPPVPADTTAPTGTLTLLTTSGGAEVTSSRTVYLKVAASEPLAGIRVSNDGETFGSLIPAPTADYSTRWTLGDHDGSRRVLIQLQDLAGNVSQGYVSDTVTLDRIAPRVQRVWPAAGATEVRRGKAVRARFDSPVTPNVALKYLAHLYRVGSTKPVAAVVRFDALTATVAVVPSKSLRADTRYKAVIESGFKDAARNFNDQDSAKAGAQRMVWKFRTR